MKINLRIGNLCNNYPKLQDYLKEWEKNLSYEDAGWNFTKNLTFDDKLDVLRQNPFIIGQEMHNQLDGKITNFIYEKMNEIIKAFEGMPKWAKENLRKAVVEE